MEILECKYAQSCAGCGLIGTPYQEQVEKKTASLKALMPGHNIEYVGLGLGGLRDRVDVTLEKGSFGFYHKEKREILDIAACPQLSPALSSWFEEFRKSLPDIEKGSIRLRVSPSGQRGVWLDFSNVDIKKLLDEKNWLKTLSEKAFVEIGQRRKQLVWKVGEAKLGGPAFEDWFVTKAGDLNIPIYCNVSSFTQPGFKANLELVRLVNDLAKTVGAQSWLELGAGIGNFTFALSALAEKVTAVESDELALEALKYSLEKNNWTRNIQMQRINFHKESKLLQDLIESHEALLVDPPRSGLLGTVNLLKQANQLPRSILYVSCYPESFRADILELKALGYKASSLKIIDQFPQTKHFETLALLER